MKTFFASLAFIGAAAFALPALAQQGSGGYPNGAPGADTVKASPHHRARMRMHHRTNDTMHGPDSIDKSGTTSEGGATSMGAQGSDQAMGAHAPGNTGGTKTSPTGH